MSFWTNLIKEATKSFDFDEKNEDKQVNKEKEEDDTIMNEDELMSKLLEEGVKLKSLESYVMENPTLDRILYVFCELLQGDNGLESVLKLLSSMKDYLKKLFQYTPTLREYIGDEEIDNFVKLLRKYSRLLQQTQSLMVKLTEQAKIQQENIEVILKLISKCANNAKLMENEEINNEFEECLNVLGLWINCEDLPSLIENWNQFCDECQTSSERWNKILSNAKKGVVKTILASLGILLLTTGIIVGVISFMTTATPVTATLLIANTIKTSIITENIWKTVSIGLSGIGFITLTSAYLSYKGKAVPLQVFNHAQLIRNSLLQMLSNGEHFSKEVNKMNNITKNQISQRLQTIKNLKIKNQIVNHLNIINQYLNDYIENGKRVQQQIGNAQEELSQFYKKM